MAKTKATNPTPPAKAAAAQPAPADVTTAGKAPAAEGAPATDAGLPADAASMPAGDAAEARDDAEAQEAAPPPAGLAAIAQAAQQLSALGEQGGIGAEPGDGLAEYEVISPLEHDLVAYAIGAPVRLSAAQAAPLLGHTVRAK